NGNAESPRIDWFVHDQQGTFQRPTPRRQQPGEHVTQHVLEQIAQPHVSETTLRLDRPRREHAVAERTRVLDTGEPEGRLADPWLTLQHECRRPTGGTVEEAGDRAELHIAPNDLDCAHTTIVTALRREVTATSRLRSRRTRPALSRRKSPPDCSAHRLGAVLGRLGVVKAACALIGSSVGPTGSSATSALGTVRAVPPRPSVRRTDSSGTG